jgi:hypothetical protein
MTSIIVGGILGVLWGFYAVHKRYSIGIVILVGILLGLTSSLVFN